MKRVRQPFFRPSRNTWFVQLDGKQINLGPDEDAAWARYHELMAQRSKKTELPASTVPYVVVILDQYIEWLRNRVAEGTKAQRTYDWYFSYVQSFTKAITSTLTIDQLQPIHVYQWVDAQTGWKSGKRGAMTAIQRAFNWACRAGLLKTLGNKSPIAHLEKPQQGRREQLVSADEYAKVLAFAKDQEFGDLLELSWETGCRPHELFTVEAHFVDLESCRWVFPVRESKGKKYQRVVYLTDKALAITKRVMVKNPTGPMLRNTDGIKWCGSSVNCRFQRIRDKLGVKYSLYAFRHAFVTGALISGLDAVTTSVLAGHRDTTMIARHYSHLTQRPDFLRKAANQAKGA